MKALIQEGRVCQIEASEFPVASSLIWVDCGDDVQTGWSYDGSSFSAPPPATIDQVRELRTVMLLATDWTQLPNSPLTDEKKTEWATYRQKLRDVPASYPDVTWPTAPS